MKFSTAAAFVATFLSAVIFAPADAVEENTGLRHLMGKKESRGRRSRNDMMMGGQGMEDKSSMMMMGGGSDSGDGSMYNLLVTNLAYQQPLSPFFVLVHSSETMPLFKYGMPASPQLAELAEDGSPAGDAMRSLLQQSHELQALSGNFESRVSFPKHITYTQSMHIDIIYITTVAQYV